MVKVVVDTSILIDHLRQGSDRFLRLTELQDEGKIKILVPYIVVTELFVGKSTREKKTEKSLDKFLSGFELVRMSYRSSKKAGELIREYPGINDAYDLLIAAIALEKKAYVYTLNVKHFKSIKGLKLYEDKN
jgi:predicted nucleic acid-binding protein